MNIKHLMVGLFVFTAATSAQSEIVTYEYSATIDSMYEFDFSKTTITHLTQGGFLTNYFRIGHELSGLLTFDTAALLSPEQNGISEGTLIYEDGVKSLTVSKPNFSYSGGSGINNNISVSTGSNSLFGYDRLYFQSSEPQFENTTQTTGISLIDYRGSTFNGFSIPSRLDLNAFQYAKLDYGWVDTVSQNQFHVFANIQTLNFVSAVPEPDSRLTLTTGILLLGIYLFKLNLKSKKTNSE